MLDFSFTWFSADYFIKCIEELSQGANNYTLKTQNTERTFLWSRKVEN